MRDRSPRLLKEMESERRRNSAGYISRREPYRFFHIRIEAKTLVMRESNERRSM